MTPSHPSDAPSATTLTQHTSNIYTISTLSYERGLEISREPTPSRFSQPIAPTSITRQHLTPLAPLKNIMSAVRGVEPLSTHKQIQWQMVSTTLTDAAPVSVAPPQCMVTLMVIPQALHHLADQTLTHRVGVGVGRVYGLGSYIGGP